MSPCFRSQLAMWKFFLFWEAAMAAESKPRSYAGFNIVGVIIAFGLAGIVIYLYTSGNASNIRVNKNLEVRDRLSSIENAISDEAFLILTNVTENDCLKD